MKKLLLFYFAGVLMGAPQPPSFRLASDAVPEHYQLDLQLDPAKDDFSGVVTVKLQVRKPVDTLWVNASNLKIKSGSFEQSGSTQSAHILPGGQDFAGFQISTPLGEGEATLKIEYSGSVNHISGAGIFLAKRNDDRYLFTQFEPIDARSAFPCFDEPGFKVPWQLTLHIPAGQIAVSNTRGGARGGRGPREEICFS
jgi:alanyl aminopeptidase